MLRFDILEEITKKLGEMILEDPQSGNKMNNYFGKRSINRYLGRLRENDEALTEHFSRYAIRYTKIYTDEEPIGKLVALFK